VVGLCSFLLCTNTLPSISCCLASIALHRLRSGYCFDGMTSCFNPFPVLSVLAAGCITSKEMEAASGTNWLGLTPAAVLQDALASSMPGPTDDIVDIAGLESRRVHAVPLLLQVGLLSLVPDHKDAYRPPNMYARLSLERMLETALDAGNGSLSLRTLAAALEARDRAAFEVEATRLLELVPNTFTKEGIPREAPFRAALLGAILASVPPSTTVVAEMQFQRGKADVVVISPEEPGTTWIFEVGLGDTYAKLVDKLSQAQAYAAGLPSSTTVVCCAVVVGRPKPASVAAKRAGTVFGFKWSQRSGEGTAAVWTPLP